MSTAEGTMKALRRDPANKTVVKVDLPRPVRPQDDHAIIQVRYAGVCGTDLHIMAGKLDVPRDLILGHEISGVVLTTGSKVCNVAPGQPVVVAPQLACGQCDPCRRGQTRLCQKGAVRSAIGFYQDGGFREHWEVPVRRLMPLPEGIPLNVGALCEPFTAVYSGWERIGHRDQEEPVLLLGSGLIGLLFASLFHLRGYERVTIAEPNEKRRQVARGRRLGYRVCDPNQLREEEEEEQEERQAGRSEEGGGKYGLIIDCSGNIAAIKDAFKWLRQGATLALFGLPPSDAEVAINPSDIILRSLSIVGIVPDPQTLARSMPTFCTLARKGYLDFDKLSIELFRFDDYQKAIDTVTQGKITKAVLDIAAC